MSIGWQDNAACAARQQRKATISTHYNLAASIGQCGCHVIPLPPQAYLHSQRCAELPESQAVGLRLPEVAVLPQRAQRCHRALVQGWVGE